MPFSEYQKDCQQRIDRILKSSLSNNSNTASAQHLMAAMKYSLFNGGKRVRPLLVYATAQAVGADTNKADAPAAAVEMIHAYSLVHDDLPAMDDDDLRRGQPTCHIAFDEATAILAGDALQTQAFAILSDTNSSLSPQQKIAMIQLLSHNSGLLGMAGGQSLDLEAVDKQVDLTYLENMHKHKTGALITASVLMGAHCHESVAPVTLQALTDYSHAIGLAFQVQDDILDVTGDTQTLGKTQGADIANNKPTYVSLLGLEGAQQKALQLHQQALDVLQPLGSAANRLHDIAHYIVDRQH
jgi:geranylgeranyl diphosphate synthase type II